MKVAFWNGSGPVDNVTEYLVAISAYYAIYTKKEVYISCNYLMGKRLEDYFFYNQARSGKEKFRGCCLYGEPDYFRQLWVEPEGHNNTGRTLEGIHLLRPPDIYDECMFHHKLPADALYFMDISCKANASSFLALEEADLVVVFLPPDRVEIHRFFDRYSSIIPKSLFIITDYRDSGSFDLTILEKIYGVEKERVGTALCSENYAVLCELGAVESFFRESELFDTKADIIFRIRIREIAEMISEYSESIKGEKGGL